MELAAHIARSLELAAHVARVVRDWRNECVGARVRRSSRFEEPFRRTLARNATIAAALGVVFAVLRRDLNLLLPVTALAMWFSLGGHYVERTFLNGVRARIPQRRPTQAFVRLQTSTTGVVRSAPLRSVTFPASDSAAARRHQRV